MSALRVVESPSKASALLPVAPQTKAQTQQDTLSEYQELEKLVLMLHFECFQMKCESTQLIPNQKNYRLLYKIHQNTVQKLQGLGFRIQKIENVLECTELRKNFEEAQLFLHSMQNWLSLSKTALAIKQRCAEIIDELHFFHKAIKLNLRQVNTEFEIEVEELQDRLDQVYQHLSSLQMRGYALPETEFQYLQCTAILESLYERMDSQLDAA